ncbi:FHA domain-containing protein [Microbacterium sp. I2]|uniref:FHA domain-containing protein n=1 Tax=Microbacterium sp. I2 TaxID=3391826 RepID=UPI003ED9B091
MPTLYAPGATPVAVTPHGFVVLGSETPHTLAARIRTLVADGRGLGGVIEALTGAYGTSLTAIPPFGVALAEGDAVRIAVRGDIAFDVEATSSERVSGAGVTTWNERLVSGVVRVVFAPEDSLPAELPVNDAVVLASVVTWDAAGASASSPPAEAKSASAASARVASVDPGDSAAGAEPVVEPVSDPEPVPDPLAAPEPEAAPARSRSARVSNPLAVPAPEPVEAPKPTRAKRGAAKPETAEQPVAAAGGTASGQAVGAAPPPEIPGLIDSRAVLSLTETLIPADSTIVRTDRDAVGTPQEAPEEPPPAKPEDDAFGATVVRGDAAPPAPPIPGDHDGETISLAQARALKAAAGESSSAAVPVSPFTSPLAPPRPPAPGQVRLSTGQVVMLDRTVVIGRRPRSTRVSGTDLPHLVAVDSPQQDISRSHVELRVEGESIVATDLRTTNGTTLLRAGSEPMRLHPGEGSVVVPGDVLDLGDGITVAIEAVS